MAIGQKLLIDTNVLIGLEDWKEIPDSFARLHNVSSRHGYHIYVHEASRLDVARDADATRRKVTLSKLKKFEELAGVRTPDAAQLAERYGKLPKPNDLVDASLLYALEIGAVDFLITEDQGIHARAQRRSPELADRVLTVAEAVAWITAAHEPRTAGLPQIQEVPAHAIDATDPIFESLREGYPEFDDWWRDKCVGQHRPCWVVTVDGRLAGLVVRKDETRRHEGSDQKVLKLCTFKVAAEFRGEKLGELLLKQALWFAERNGYQSVYLTTFPTQTSLLAVLEYFGFERSAPDDRGELTLDKKMRGGWLAPIPGVTDFDAARLNYPRFVPPPAAPLYCVPIQGEFHEMLFPELGDRSQPTLFEALGIAISSPRTPGNTIRKVYLSKTSTTLPSGAVIAFYRSAKKPGPLSQSITTLGVVDRVTEANELEALVRLTAKRSVYRVDQLKGMIEAGGRPVKVIDFLLMAHLESPIGVDELIASGIFSRHPPQSIAKMAPSAFETLARRLNTTHSGVPSLPTS